MASTMPSQANAVPAPMTCPGVVIAQALVVAVVDGATDGTPGVR